MMGTIPTSAAIIAANNDNDLRERARALGAALGYTPHEVDQLFHRIIVAPINEGGSTLASVHEYVSSKYAQALANVPPRPGLDPAGVRDDQILDALRAVMTHPEPETA